MTAPPSCGRKELGVKDFAVCKVAQEELETLAHMINQSVLVDWRGPTLHHPQ